MQKLWIISCFIILLNACQTKQVPDLEAEKQKILLLHKQQRDFHFEKNAKDFAQLMSQDFISVNRGNITTPSQQENETRFQQYFNSVEFVKWEDMKEPIIRFSEDGSVAYTIVDKEVIIRFRQDDGKQVEETTHFAWVAIYKKYGSDWKIDCVASTNETPIIK